MRIKLSRRAWGACATAAAAVALLGASVPAQAATSPWHMVYSHHYGPASNYSGFLATVALGPKNVWELGGTDLSHADEAAPAIVHWNGASWTGSAAPAGVTGYIQAASADSPSDIWAVTFETGYVLHYNGARWSVAKRITPSGGVLTDVIAISPKNVWVFGNSGFGPGAGTWHFNGTAWQHATTAKAGNNIGEASAASASNIWAVGASSTQPAGEIDHFNGSSWTPVSNPLLTGLTLGGIHAFSATNVWVLGRASTTRSFLMHYGNHWSEVLIPWGYTPRGGISSDGSTGLWFQAGPAGSQATYAVHWFPGNKWQRFALNPRVDGGPVNIPGTRSMVVVGDPLAGNGSNAAVWVDGSI